LTESIEMKNRRTFGGLFELQSNQNLLCYFNLKAEGAKTFYNLYSSIFYGAAKLSISLVQTIPSLKEAWGKGDNDRAVKIFEICCNTLMSYACRKIREGKNWSADQIAEVTGSRFEDLTGIMQSEADIEDCMRLDAQYNYDLDNYPDNLPALPIYSRIFKTQLCTVLDLPVDIDWRCLKYPVDNPEVVQLSGDVEDTAAVSGLIIEAGEIMLGTFEKFMRENKGTAGNNS
jgi:hypothetical protein